MAKVNISKLIEDELLNGANRQSLNLKYNKGTVTKVFNRLKKLNLLPYMEVDNVNKINNTISNVVVDNNSKEMRIEKLLIEVFEILNKNNKYEINISITKKSNEESSEEILNPFELYDEKGKDEMIKELRKNDTSYLIKLIRKNFKVNGINIKRMSEIELADYIAESVEKVLDIGKCFR